MSYRVKCPNCGHETRAYLHKLNQPLVFGLRKLVIAYSKKHKRIKLHDLELNNNLFTNFQKLQYFGLVQRNAEG